MTAIKKMVNLFLFFWITLVQVQLLKRLCDYAGLDTFRSANCD